MEQELTKKEQEDLFKQRINITAWMWYLSAINEDDTNKGDKKCQK